MINKIKRAAIFILLLICCTFLIPANVFAEDDDDNKYEISDSWWEENQGCTKCCWKSASSGKNYQVRIYKRTSKNKHASVSEQALKKFTIRNSCELDVTDLILSEGTGYYYFYVYTTSHYSDGNLSDTIAVDNDYISMMKYEMDKRERIQKDSLRQNSMDKEDSEIVTLDDVEIRVSSRDNGSGNIQKISFKLTRGTKIANVVYSNSENQWTAGVPVTVTFDLLTDSSHTFSDSTQYLVTGAECVGNTGDCSRRNMQIMYYPQYKLESPTVWYVDESDYLHWYPVEYCSEYCVQIYQNNKRIKRILSKSEKIDISDYLEKETSLGIQAITNKKYYVNSAVTKIEDIDTMYDESYVPGKIKKSSGKVIVDICSDDYEAGWQYIAGKWYYLDTNGYAKTGWFDDTTGYTYYFDEYGIMTIGKVIIDDVEYSFNDGSHTDIPIGALLQ